MSIASTRYNDELRVAWCEVFEKLAEQALNLRVLYVFFAPATERQSPGYDEKLISALGQITIRKSIELAGEYSDQWPEYLRRTTGAEILDTGDRQILNI